MSIAAILIVFGIALAAHGTIFWFGIFWDGIDNVTSRNDKRL